MKSRHCGTWKPHDVSRVHLPFSNRRDGGGSVTFVGFFGLLMGLLGALFAFAQPTRARITVFVFCYLMHVAAAVFYHELVKSGGGDAAFYYYDPGRIFDNGFGPNTAFIIYLVQFPKTLFGGTFLDYFLVFQAVGFWGLVFLMRTLEEVYSEAGVDQPWTVYLLLFLPSLHYWSSSVGKDSLFFFAICAALWASMQFKRRIIVLVIAMLIMLLIRSYVAVIAFSAFALTVLIDRRTHPALRLLLFAVSLVATSFAIRSVWTTFRFDITNVDSITGMLSSREGFFEGDSAGNTAVDASYPVRVLSLLFRPFFYDANNLFGFVVSLENLGQVMITFFILARVKLLRQIMRTVAFARYAIVSSIGLILALGLGYYNVGLGIRQEATMILPGLIVVFVTILAVGQARQLRSAQLVKEADARQAPGLGLGPAGF
jgi:hypothetical protein